MTIISAFNKKSRIMTIRNKIKERDQQRIFQTKHEVLA